MSRTTFWSIYTPFALIAVIVGWMIGTPRPSATAVARASAQAAQVAAASAALSRAAATQAKVAELPPVQGADTAQGWEGRQALRGQLSNALDRVEAAPCEPGGRAAFLTAYADRAGATAEAAQASSTGERPDAWLTPDDTLLDGRVDQLAKQHWFTQDEIGLAVVRRRMGDGFIASQAAPGSARTIQAAGEARCPNLAASHDHG